MKKRYKFLIWLRTKIFKVPEGGMSPKFIIIIQHILFPLHYFYTKQANVRFDYKTDTYFIRGTKISGNVFDFLNSECNEGRLFRFVKLEKDGAITLQSIDSNTIFLFKPNENKN